MKIADGQVHVWQPESADRPWPKGGPERAQLPYALTCERLLAMMDEAGVDRAILVPPSWEGDRNDHALAGAAAHPDRFAVMGRLALDQPDNAKLLKDWKKQPGMLGVRLTFVLGA
jgi:L-fuconolactonase